MHWKLVLRVQVLYNCLSLLLQTETSKVNSTVIAVWVYIVNVTLAANIKNCQLCDY